MLEEKSRLYKESIRQARKLEQAIKVRWIDLWVWSILMSLFFFSV